MAMTMAQAAKRLGISVSLIRHYEKEFDLKFGRNKSGQRILTERDLENLRIVRSFREKNVAIDEIREHLNPPVEELEPAKPAIEEVIAALLARQDELERVVMAQQEAINDMRAENQRLLAAQDQVRLLLEAPEPANPAVDQLAGQMAELEASSDRKLQELRRKLEYMQAELQAIPDDAQTELLAMQSRLAELEREVKEPRPPGAQDEVVVALQCRLQELEAALASKVNRSAESEALKSLQRRLLDLEAALATKEEAQDEEDERLLQTLVTTIAKIPTNRKPWWRFWGS